MIFDTVELRKEIKIGSIQLVFICSSSNIYPDSSIFSCMRCNSFSWALLIFASSLSLSARSRSRSMRRCFSRSTRSSKARLRIWMEQKTCYWYAGRPYLNSSGHAMSHVRRGFRGGRAPRASLLYKTSIGISDSLVRTKNACFQNNPCGDLRFGVCSDADSCKLSFGLSIFKSANKFVPECLKIYCRPK